MPQEKTFSTYNAAQGEHYAKVRRNYHPSVYQYVLDQHRATGGQFNVAVDVGCGPGIVTRSLAPHFTQHVYGFDPAPGMLTTARTIPDTPANVSYGQGTAENFGKDPSDVPLPDGSVDLITAGNAAHWFDMPGFWARAAEVLRPHGTVALWTSGDLSVHPATKAADEVQEAMEKYRTELEPYFNDGNRIARGAYRDLVLPWTTAAASAFPEALYVRRDWEFDEEFMTQGAADVNMDMMELLLSTSSPYTRWCEANPNDVRTEKDLLRKLRREVERIQQAAGVEKGQESVRGVALGAVLTFKKVA